MFFSKGWIPLREVFEFVSYAYFSKTDEPGWGEFTGDENFELTWQIAEDSREIAVMNLTGNLIPASPRLVIAENQFNHSNRHVNLLFGTVGSSDWEGRGHANQSELEMRAEYGPFLFLPILLPRKHFIESLQEFEGSSDGRTSNSPATLSKRIVDAFDKDGPITFNWAKNQLGPMVSHRAFRHAWTLASDIRPELSKPGPRVKNE